MVQLAFTKPSNMQYKTLAASCGHTWILTVSSKCQYWPGPT